MEKNTQIMFWSLLVEFYYRDGDEQRLHVDDFFKIIDLLSLSLSIFFSLFYFDSKTQVLFFILNINDTDFFKQ